MSRQSSLVEDRISSDEDEFQEERTGTFHTPPTNGLYLRALSLPTSCSILHLNASMTRQICRISTGHARPPARHCPSKRAPPEPDLIREILAQNHRLVDGARAGGGGGGDGGVGEDGRVSGPEGINADSTLKATVCSVATLPASSSSSVAHHCGRVVRETRSTPVLSSMDSGYVVVAEEKGQEGGDEAEDAETEVEVEDENGHKRKRKRFKLRSCLIRSCISH